MKKKKLMLSPMTLLRICLTGMTICKCDYKGGWIVCGLELIVNLIKDALAGARSDCVHVPMKLP